MSLVDQRLSWFCFVLPSSAWRAPGLSEIHFVFQLVLHLQLVHVLVVAGHLGSIRRRELPHAGDIAMAPSCSIS